MSAPQDSLQKAFDDAFAAMSQARETFALRLAPHEVGTVLSVATGIAKVSGLSNVGFEELVSFPGGVLGIAFNVDEDEIGVVLLGDYSLLHAGDEVERTGRVMDVAVGDGLVGRVIDPWAIRWTGGGRWSRVVACPSNARPAHHGPSAGHGTAAVGPEGYRRSHSDRPRPTRVDLGRPADGQDGHCDRHDPQPKRKERRVRVLRDWPASFRRGEGRGRPPREGRDGLHRRGCDRG